MRISEVFPSAQLEGVNFGVPCVFVRFAGCNLYCDWCDTKYANASNLEDDWILEKVVNKIREEGKKHVVFTGGEPLLQQDEMSKIVERLPEYYFEVETNGTVMPSNQTFRNIDLFTVSPKLSSSLIEEKIRILPEILSRYVTWIGWKDIYFKFVIKTQEDWSEMENLIAEFQIPSQTVIVMPCATTIKEIHSRRWVFWNVIKAGYRFSLRGQTILFGKRRGI